MPRSRLFWVVNVIKLVRSDASAAYTFFVTASQLDVRQWAVRGHSVEATMNDVERSRKSQHQVGVTIAIGPLAP
jgi:hypothetical protein